MFYPKLKSVPVKAYKTNSFGGLVHSSFVPENCFYDMENLTSDKFPLLSVREKRGLWTGHTDYAGIKAAVNVLTYPHSGITALAKVSGKICCCGHSEVTLDGDTILGANLSSNVAVRTIVPLGKNVFIAPDGKYIKVLDRGYEIISCDVPVMDFAIEHNNRIFACRYGKNRDGKFVNEIYASALGDPTKWYTFEGISTDSYIASLGCSGEFTGVAALGNEVLFFKEEYIIRVTGSSPSDFSVFSFPARGVEKGAHLSVINLNEKVFYKSRSGVTVYDGALPMNISEQLGEEHFTDAVAGGILGKYYIAMTDEKQKRSIYVYDTKTGLWHKEDDNYPTKYMVNLQGCLYFVKLVASEVVGDVTMKRYSFYIHDKEKVKEAVNIFGNSYDYFGFEYLPEEDVSWFAETGKLGENINPEKQYLRRLSLTLSLEKGAHFSLYILPDNGHEWKKLCFVDTPHDGVFTVPVSTVPCHSFRLRIEGKGGFILYSITRHCEISSEVRELG